MVRQNSRIIKLASSDWAHFLTNTANYENVYPVCWFSYSLVATPDLREITQTRAIQLTFMIFSRKKAP